MPWQAPNPNRHALPWEVTHAPSPLAAAGRGEGRGGRPQNACSRPDSVPGASFPCAACRVWRRAWLRGTRWGTPWWPRVRGARAPAAACAQLRFGRCAAGPLRAAPPLHVPPARACWRLQPCRTLCGLQRLAMPPLHACAASADCAPSCSCGGVAARVCRPGGEAVHHPPHRRRPGLHLHPAADRGQASCCAACLCLHLQPRWASLTCRLGPRTGELRPPVLPIFAGLHGTSANARLPAPAPPKRAGR